MLLFNNNPYQQHVYLTSANKVSSAVYSGVSSVTSYFHLREINQDLQMRNAILETELINTKSLIKDYELMHMSDSVKKLEQYNKFDFILANVINNSHTKPSNYITIDKGSADGVDIDMGVVDQNGVVGIVDVVGEHSSRIISFLNPKFSISGKVKNSDFYGNLVWDGQYPDQVLLEDMPQHLRYNKGDTIVTSGYSAAFPMGIIIGTFIEKKSDKRTHYNSIRIKITTDFTQLSTVRVIKNFLKEDLSAVENDEITDGGVPK